MSKIELRSLSFRDDIEAMKFLEDQVPQNEVDHYWTHDDRIVQLANMGNHVVVGRRGAGKTTLLKRFSNQMNRELTDRRILVVYLDAKHYRNVNDDNAMLEDMSLVPAFAGSFAQHIINALADGLRRFRDYLEGIVQNDAIASYGDRALGGERLSVARDIRPIISQLEALTYLEGDAPLDLKRHGTDITRVITEEFLPRAKLKGIKVVIDDFTRVSMLPSFQAWVLEHLKPLLSGGKTHSVSLALGAIQQEMLLSYPGRKVGLTLSDDLRLIDLEATHGQPDGFTANRDKFLSTVLFRHLAVRVKTFREAVYGSLQLPTFDGREYVDSTDSRWNLIFEQPQRCVSELVSAAQGNPRDLLQMFYRSWERFLASMPAERLRLVDVLGGIKYHYSECKREALAQDPYARMVLERICEEFVVRPRSGSGSMVFLARVDDLSDTSPQLGAIRALEVGRLIRRLQENFRSRSDGRYYAVFEINNGVLVDWTFNAVEAGITRRRQGSDTDEYEQAKRRIAWSIDEGRISAYILDFPAPPAYEHLGGLILCMHCAHRFQRGHAVFVRAKICPECGLPPRG